MISVKSRKKFTRKLTLLTCGLCTLIAITMIFSFVFNKGELVVTLNGVVPDSVIVDGPIDNRLQVFDSFRNNRIQIRPLPYGVYQITMHYTDRSIEFIVYHQNNWQKEHLTVSINKDFTGSARLYVEEKLEKEIDIDQTSFEVENIMSWI